MDALISTTHALRGRLSVPADKSIVHRAVLLAAVATGTTTIRPWPSGDDCQRTVQLIERLGVVVHRADGAVTITGRGHEGLQAPQAPLECGESGTTLRLAAGLLAGQPFRSELRAGASLSRRPMRRIVEPLARMGAQVHGRAGGASSDELFPPLTIQGARPLRAIRYELPVASAQVKSAVLLAGLSAQGRTSVLEPRATRDHTERALRHFGASVEQAGGVVTLDPAPLASPGALDVPGDISSAAFFLVAAAAIPGSQLTVEGVSLNPTRAAIVDVLRRMGAAISVQEAQAAWEPRGTLTVQGGPLRAIQLAAEEIPGVIDELPILLVAAACAQGTSRFEGVAELRVKETDRIQSMAEGLRRLGARVSVQGSEAVEVEGGPLQGAAVEAAGDHRTAMSLAVAGLLARGTTTVRGAECVAKSLPEFFTLLQPLVDPSTVKTVDKT